MRKWKMWGFRKLLTWCECEPLLLIDSIGFLGDSDIGFLMVSNFKVGKIGTCEGEEIALDAKIVN